MKNTLVLLRNSLLIFLLFASVAAIVLSPLSNHTLIPGVLDYLDHFAAIVQAKMALAEGQFPLRIMPEQFSGMRYPFFQFDSPTNYYFAALIYRWITPANPFVAYKLLIGCALVGGGIYMYRLALWLVKSSPAALLASVVYLTSPYYLIVVDHLGSLNEAVALGILPAVLYYTLARYYFPHENKTLLQTSLVWYLLATIHVVTFFYATFFIALLLLLGAIKNPKYRLNLIGVVTAYAFACLLAMWYLAPLIIADKYLNLRSLSGSLTQFQQFHPSFSTLMSPAQNFLKGIPDARGMINSITQIQPSIGLPILMGVGMCLYVILNKQKIDNSLPDFWLSPLIILFVIAFLMIWSPINFWGWLPASFAMGHYTWCLLGQLIWIGALLLAWAIVWLFKSEFDYQQMMFGIFLILLATSTWLNIPEKQTIAVIISDIVHHPALVWNDDSYLIDVIRNPKLVHAIDKKLVDLSDMNNGLVANTNYYFPSSIIKNAVTPFIFLEGNFPENSNAKMKELQVVVNDKVMAHYPIKAGAFFGNIPLNLDSLAKEPTFSLLLKIDDAPANTKVEIRKMLVGGYLNPATIISMEQAKPNCRQQKKMTICEIQAQANTKLIELPVFYFPKLLRITLNGKPVPYSSVLNENNLITAVTAIPSVLNLIKIQFVGLPWANTISMLAFFVWVLILVWVLTGNFIFKQYHEQFAKNENGMS